MLKNNEATELCATNGAEGRVVGWDYGQDSHGRKILRTLFVRLSAPSRPVSIPGLPVNVVPVVSLSTKLYCTLRDDRLQYIDRKQPQVLPNFAMTDYGSQGRTRVDNVVDMRYCKGHRFMYTVLSRGTSLQGTLIVQDFDERKIMGSLRDELRTEFRELEILDDITQMRFKGELHEQIKGVLRSDLVAAYQVCKGLHYVPPGVHRAVEWSKDSPEKLIRLGRWREVKSVKRKAGDVSNESSKRRRLGHSSSPALMKSVAHSVDVSATDSFEHCPVGPTDSGEGNCGVNAVIAIFWTWKAGWAERSTLQVLMSKMGSVEDVSKGAWAFLHSDGVRGTNSLNIRSVGHIVRTLLRSDSAFGKVRFHCSRCPSGDWDELCYAPVWNVSQRFWSRGTMPHTVKLSDIFAGHTHGHLRMDCSRCKGAHSLTTAHSFYRPPERIVFELSRVWKNWIVEVENSWSAQLGDHATTWVLCGVVYSGHNHFTARTVDPNGNVCVTTAVNGNAHWSVAVLEV